MHEGKQCCLQNMKNGECWNSKASALHERQPKTTERKRWNCRRCHAAYLMKHAAESPLTRTLLRRNSLLSQEQEQAVACSTSSTHGTQDGSCVGQRRNEGIAGVATQRDAKMHTKNSQQRPRNKRWLPHANVRGRKWCIASYPMNNTVCVSQRKWHSKHVAQDRTSIIHAQESR